MLLLGAGLAFPAWSAVPGQPAVATSVAGQNAIQIKQLNEQTQQQQKQVEHLRDQVQKLERNNQSDQQKLHEKDAAIADLRKRLQALHEHQDDH